MDLNFKDIHIGKLIYQIVKFRDIDESRILNFFDNPNLGLDAIYESKDASTEDLLKWSKLLKYDLFRVYSQHIMLYANMETLTHKVKDNNSLVPTFKKNIYTKEVISFICELISNKQMTIDQVIKKYNIPKTTIYRWVKKYSI